MLKNWPVRLKMLSVDAPSKSNRIDWLCTELNA